MLAYAAGNHQAAIANFEDAIESGHAGAHASLAWLMQRVYIDSRPYLGISKTESVNELAATKKFVFNLAKRGASMGCRQEDAAALSLRHARCTHDNLVFRYALKIYTCGNN
jgi:hypothetical protein